MLKYQGKFYFIVGKYEQAIAHLTKLLELEANSTFALKYRGEAYYMIKKYRESRMDLNKLLENNTNDEWILKTCKNLYDYMNPPTAWSIDDKSNYINVNFDGLRVDYAGEFIVISYGTLRL